VKLGDIVERVVFLYILRNVIPGTTLTECTKTSPEGMYKVSDHHNLGAECFWILLVNECFKRHLKILGWVIKLSAERLVANVKDDFPTEHILLLSL
jgi:hypothetical protein